MNQPLSRKTFLTQLGLGGLGLLLPRAPGAQAAPATMTPPVHLQHCRIAGLRHYQYHFCSVRPGDALALIAEPDNPYDRYAVEVYWINPTPPGPTPPNRVDDRAPNIGKLGYLPRHANHVVSHLLRQGKTIRGTLKAIHPEERIDRRLEIKLELI